MLFQTTEETLQCVSETPYLLWCTESYAFNIASKRQVKICT